MYDQGIQYKIGVAVVHWSDFFFTTPDFRNTHRRRVAQVRNTFFTRATRMAADVFFFFRFKWVKKNGSDF